MTMVCALRRPGRHAARRAWATCCGVGLGVINLASTRVCRNAGVSQATTGRPAAAASASVKPNPSSAEREQKMANDLYHRSGVEVGPAKWRRERPLKTVKRRLISAKFGFSGGKSGMLAESTPCWWASRVMRAVCCASVAQPTNARWKFGGRNSKARMRRSRRLTGSKRPM